MVEHNIKTLVISTIRPYMVGFQIYYKEMYDKLLAKLNGQDQDILTTNELIVALSTRVLELEAARLIDAETMSEMKSQMANIKTALISAGFNDVDGLLEGIPDPDTPTDPDTGDTSTDNNQPDGENNE